MPAGQLSLYGAQQILGGYFGATNTPPATWFLALCTSVPTPEMTGTEVGGYEPPSASNYSRLAIPNTGGSGGQWLVNANAAYVMNTEALFWPASPVVGATADWPTCQGWALCDAITGGNCWAVGTLGSPVSVPSGFCAYLWPNSLSVELSPFYTIATG